VVSPSLWRPVVNPDLAAVLDQHFSPGYIAKRHRHAARVHSPLFYPALRQASGHLQVSCLAPLVSVQVLEERLALPFTRLFVARHLRHGDGAR